MPRSALEDGILRQHMHCIGQVIREGRPCHLYMDLEYVPAVNPDADGEALVEALLCLVSDGIRSAQGQG